MKPDWVLVADRHARGPGKTHHYDMEDGKTLCGLTRARCPGRVVLLDEGGYYEDSTGWHPGEITCRGCELVAIARDERAERERERGSRGGPLGGRQWIEDDQRWQEWYYGYLQTPEWQARRAKVMLRAGGVCEGCGDCPPELVHHRTYEHVGAELLWELAAICCECHRRLHPDKPEPTVYTRATAPPDLR